MSPSFRQNLALANYRQLRKAGYAIDEIGPIYENFPWSSRHLPERSLIKAITAESGKATLSVNVNESEPQADKHLEMQFTLRISAIFVKHLSV
jgi:hypothetical protein